MMYRVQLNLIGKERMKGRYEGIEFRLRNVVNSISRPGCHPRMNLLQTNVLILTKLTENKYTVSNLTIICPSFQNVKAGSQNGADSRTGS